MCGDPRCASDPRHASQECRVMCENRVKVRLDGHGLPHFIYSVVAALRMMDALDAHVSLKANSERRSIVDRIYREEPQVTGLYSEPATT